MLTAHCGCNVDSPLCSCLRDESRLGWDCAASSSCSTIVCVLPQVPLQTSNVLFKCLCSFLEWWYATEPTRSTGPMPVPPPPAPPTQQVQCRSGICNICSGPIRNPALLLSSGCDTSYLRLSNRHRFRVLLRVRVRCHFTGQSMSNNGNVLNHNTAHTNIHAIKMSLLLAEHAKTMSRNEYG